MDFMDFLGFLPFLLDFLVSFWFFFLIPLSGFYSAFP